MDIQKKVAARRAELAEQRKEQIQEERVARKEAKEIAKSRVAHINPKDGAIVTDAPITVSATKATQQHIDIAMKKEVDSLADNRMTALESKTVMILGLGGLVMMFFAFPIGLIMFIIGVIYHQVVRSKYKEQVQKELDSTLTSAEKSGVD